MNKAKLTDICHKISNKTGLSFNTVMLYYFMESILKRFSDGENRNNIIFKGGFLLSNVVGVEIRSTVDIDFLLININMSEKEVLNILQNILDKNFEDGITYEVKNIASIKEEDQYGGFRASILCKFDNIRLVVPLDIATGDIVTPNPIDYDYISLFGDEKIHIKAYTIETIIAEKLHTIYSRGYFNSRSKDYYDLYILYRIRCDEIDFEILKKACIRTFDYRNTELNLVNIEELLQNLKYDEKFLKNWKSYAKKNKYVGTIQFEEVIDDILKIIKEIN